MSRQPHGQKHDALKRRAPANARRLRYLSPPVDSMEERAFAGAMLLAPLAPFAGAAVAGMDPAAGRPSRPTDEGPRIFSSDERRSDRDEALPEVPQVAFAVPPTDPAGGFAPGRVQAPSTDWDILEAGDEGEDPGPLSILPFARRADDSALQPDSGGGIGGGAAWSPAPSRWDARPILASMGSPGDQALGISTPGGAVALAAAPTTPGSPGPVVAGITRVDSPGRPADPKGADDAGPLAGERPVLTSVLRHGKGADARVVAEGVIASDAPVGAAFRVEIRAADGAGRLLGATRAIKMAPGDIPFEVALDVDVEPGSLVVAQVVGGGRSAAVAVRPGSPNARAAGTDGTGDDADCGCHKGPKRAADVIDGNRDGVADKSQAGVASLDARGSRRLPVTIDARGRSLRRVEAVEAPAGDVQFPLGLFQFEIHDVTPGGSASVDVYLPEGTPVGGYYKLNPATGLPEPFEYDGRTGAMYAGSVVTLHFVDGGRGDADGIANGVIVDPGGPISPVRVIDDGAAGWTATPAGSWTVSNDVAGYYGSGVRVNSANGGGEYVEYSFPVTQGKIYQFSTTWTAAPNRTTAAPYAIYNNGSVVASPSINQTVAPNDYRADDVWWEELGGQITATGSTLKVRLSEAASGLAVADAVRLEEVDATCRSVLDVALVLDGSGSISGPDFALMKSFANQVVDAFDVASDATRIGIFQFATQGTGRKEIGLSGDPTALDTAINAMTQLGSSTDIQEGLALARTELAANGRTGIPSAVILLTDGVHNQPGDPVAEAAAIKATGTRVYSVGVGSGIDTNQLNAIASDPDGEHVFLASSFATLLQKVEEIAATVCATQGVGSIAGSVYSDLGADAARGTGEPGIGGATVILEGNDKRGRIVRRTARTESDGSFRFDQLWPGTYSLTQLQPAGYLDAGDAAGTAGGVVQDDRITSIRIGAGQDAVGYLFGEHRAPTFTSSPILDILAGKAYAYDADATDPDGDPLTYALLSAPTGMSINATTGAISWSPTVSDVGAHAISVQASDGRGGIAVQDFRLVVYSTLANRPPRFTSDPVVDASVNVAYAYQATAADPDQDPLTFSLTTGPSGMTVSSSGLVQWTPPASLFTSDQVSGSGASPAAGVTVPVTLSVSDGRGGSDTQVYSILVRPKPSREPNRPPIIVSAPQTEYRVPATPSGSTIMLPTTIRDFRASHEDFQPFPEFPGWQTGVVTGLVSSTLGPDRKPTFVGTSGQGAITSTTTFNQWYRDVPGVNRPANFPLVLTETFAGSGIYRYSDDTFFPIDNAFFGNEGDFYLDPSNQPHNFHFTLEMHARFTYTPGGQTFTIKGDDDLWIYVNNQLVVDLGGVHGVSQTTLNLDAVAASLGLVSGQNYPIDLFYAERRSSGAALTFETNTILTPYRPYGYDVDAIDPDNDPVAYELVSPAPSGMWIDPATGQIAWQPTAAQVGNHTVKVRASDGRGGVDIQEYTLTVHPATSNTAPQFSPNVALVEHRVNLGETYDFTARATDADGDPLTWSLTSGPSGLQLDPFTGTFTWAPTAAQVGGTFDAWIQVSDGRGGTDVLQVELYVARLINNDPVFSTGPVITGRSSWLYRYDAKATDADGDRIKYDLPLAPSGMVVHPDTGSVVWVPRPDQVGIHDVILRALDSQGGIRLQAYQVTVSPQNRVPTFVSTPPAPALVGRAYTYAAKATDLDSDTLTYSLLSPTPGGVSINSSTGVITWSTPALGTPTIKVQASDGFGGIAIQTFTLPVIADPGNRAPTITSDARTVIRAGRRYLFQVTATDLDNDPLTFGLLTPPGDMAFVPGYPGLVSWTPTEAELGSRSFTVTVSDGRGGTASKPVTVNVVTQDVNRDPAITSAPRTAGVAEQPYRYQLAGSDPDNDPILWSLEGSVPAGMTIDAEKGLIVWNPRTDQIGTHQVTVRARDHLGGVSAPQQYTLTVRGTNLPPRITSDPPTRAGRSQAYSYAAQAVDPEGDPLTYSLVAPVPSGMTINASTGVISWTPGAALALGSYPVQVRADDGFGGVDIQSYSIELLASLPNLPPRITSDPLRFAPTGAVYAYPVTAADPEGQAITYSVVAPAWLSYNATNQRVQGTPPAAGTYTVTVKATDSLGAWASQTYTLTVRANAAPTIAAMPAQQITAGQTFRYNVPAADADGDPLTFALVSPPAGMSIDDRGRITWTPTIPQVSGTPYTVRVKATDPFGASTGEQTFALTVAADTTAPVVDLMLSASEIEEGGRVTFLVTASDNVAVSSLSLTVNGVAVALDGHGAATLTMPANGTFAVVAKAKDAANNEGTATASLVVLDPNNLAPVVAITSPAEDAVIRTVVDIRGNISDDAYPLTYTLTAIPLEGGPARILAQNVSVPSAISNGVLGQFDPTILANGSYIIRLEATDAGSRKTRDETIVSVAGDLKLGNFAVSFVDLTIPVAGIPITVSRTYDSLRAHEDGDLGYGWRLDFGDMKVRVSRPDSSLGAFGDQVPFRDGTRVTVTGPDGKPQGFTFQPIPYGQLGLVLGYYINFVPDPGVNARLTVPRQSEILLTKAGTEYISLDMGGIPYNPTDPAFGATYDLTDEIGLAHTIDAESGDLLALTDRFGNRLDFAADGIFSGSGRNVLFERDPATGRITALVDPNQNRVRYGYNAAGDLISVTDRLNNPPVEYIYDPTRPHYLAEIEDQLGRKAVRVQYDANGRIGTMTDADNKSVSNTYNAASRTQTATDNSASTSTTITYSEYGDITRTVNALGDITKRIYNGRHLVSETVVIGLEDTPGGESNDLTTAFTTDARGRVLSATDPAGRTTRMTYSASGQATSVTDAAGISSRYFYDEGTGKLLFTIDPSQQSKAFGYDSRGLLTNVKSQMDSADWLSGGYGDEDGNGVPISPRETTFTYNQFGEITHKTDHNIITTYSYDNNGNGTGSSWTWINPSNPTDTRTVAIVNEFDANDRLIRSADSLGETRTDYDILGRAWRTTDALGIKTESFYDSRGLVIAIRRVDAIGNILSISGMVYDAQGRRIYADDVHKPGQPTNGTRTIYDDLGRVVETRRYGGMAIALNLVANPPTSTLTTSGTLLSTSTTTYDDAGRIVTSVGETGTTITYEHDSAGRQTAVVVSPAIGVNYRTETEYDAAGRIIISRDPLDRETRTQYDAVGHAVKTTFHDGNSISTAYDSRGRRISSTDQAGQSTEYEYDNRNQLTGVTLPSVLDPEASSVPTRPRQEYEYDNYGNLALSRDAKGRETTFTYDQHGLRTSRTLPMGQSESSTYDALGRLSTRTDFKGQVAKYSYDTQGRVATIGYFTSTSAPTPTSTVTYTYDFYDSEGRHDSIVDSRHGTTTQVYDIEGRPIRRSSPEGTIRYTYDTLGRKSRTYTDRTDIRYTYDALGRLSTVAAHEVNDTIISTPLTTTYAYDAVGNLTSTAMPNGTTETRQYDDLGRLTLVEHKQGITTLARFAYTLGPTGNRLAVDELGGRRVQYSYDNLYRLTKEVILVNGVQTREIRDTYDLVGNRLTRNDTGGGTHMSDLTYYYDANDRLTSYEGPRKFAEFTYDANGAMITEEDEFDNQSATYTWDLAGRLSEANINGQSYSYTYDEDGMRVSSSVGAQQTKYLIDKEQAYDQVMEEFAPGGAMAASYFHGLDLLFQDRVGTRSFYHNDASGSVRAITNSTGATTDTYIYNAFGQILTRTGTTVNNYQFAGEQYDANLKQTYLRARYYDPSAGRFTRMDDYEGQSDQPLTLNKYSYGHSDPVNNIDPTGMFSIGSLTISIGTGSTLYNMSMGAILGAGLGATTSGIDAHLGGEDWREAAIRGAVTGFIFGAAFGGAAGSWKRLSDTTHTTLKVALLGFDAASTAVGTLESWLNGEMDQAGFRLFAGLAGFGLLNRIPVCFAAGTPLLTPDGDKPIEQFRVGDEILSRSEFDPEGPLESKRVEEIFSRSARILELHVGNNIVKVTEEHPFWVWGRGWCPAAELRAGDQLSSHDGQRILVEEVTCTEEISAVYNLRVADFHTYFIGCDEWGFSIWAHNVCWVRDAGERMALASKIRSMGFKKTTQPRDKNYVDKIVKMAEDMIKNPTTFRWDEITEFDKIIVNQDGVVMGGNHRVIAAALAGIKIPENQIHRENFQLFLDVYDWIDTLPIPKP